MDVRWFSPIVEAAAADWRQTILSNECWRMQSFPGAIIGEAQGFFVSAGIADGFAKDSGETYRCAHEKIASDLAYHLGLPVPPAVLWRSGNRRRVISRVPFPSAFDWGTVCRGAPKSIGRIMPELSRVGSAMIAFDTWVANADRCNSGNVLVTQALDRGIGCAYIDYAWSLSHTWGDDNGRGISERVGPYPPEISLDREILVETIHMIEALPQSLLEEIVRRIPDLFIEKIRREAILACLLKRRLELRAFLGL